MPKYIITKFLIAVASLSRRNPISEVLQYVKQKERLLVTNCAYLFGVPKIHYGNAMYKIGLANNQSNVSTTEPEIIQKLAGYILSTN